MAAAAASLPTIANHAYADSPFRFSPFSSSQASQASQEDKSSDDKSDAKPAVEEPSKSGFDAEALERGAKALREINSSPNAKQVLLHFWLNLFHFLVGFVKGNWRRDERDIWGAGIQLAPKFLIIKFYDGFHDLVSKNGRV